VTRSHPQAKAQSTHTTTPTIAQCLSFVHRLTHLFTSESLNSSEVAQHKMQQIQVIHHSEQSFPSVPDFFTCRVAWLYTVLLHRGNCHLGQLWQHRPCEVCIVHGKQISDNNPTKANANLVHSLSLDVDLGGTLTNVVRFFVCCFCPGPTSDKMHCALSTGFIRHSTSCTRFKQ